jgi:hypothetical protein
LFLSPDSPVSTSLKAHRNLERNLCTVSNETISSEPVSIKLCKTINVAKKVILKLKMLQGEE